MKQLTKKHTTELLDISFIKSFEEKYNIALSDIVKNTISEHQGGKVSEILFFNSRNEMWILNAFFSFKETVELFEEFIREYHRKLVPFAFDPGGWHFCLCLDEGADYGKIIINRWTDHLPEVQFLIIADSFEEFIDGLKREEEIS